MQAIEGGFSNKEVAFLLRSVAAVYTILNENRFKIVAYENAASTIEYSTRELKDLWQEGKLDEVPTLGPSIRASLEEYFKTGHARHFESILKKVPSSMFVLMRIPSIGPKKAYKLVRTLKLLDPKTVVSDLKQAARDGRIAKIPTFGEKSESDILAAISRYENRKDKGERMPLSYAFSQALAIQKYLGKNPKIKRIDMLGSLRRLVPTIGDLDFAVVGEEQDTKEILGYFTAYPKKIAVSNSGEKKASIIVPPHIRVDLRVQSAKTYGSMLQYFTGSKAHNIKLREYAMKKNLSLSEYGIKNTRTGKTKAFAEEKSFYAFLKMSWPPPELREGTNEIELALQNKLPQLIDLADLKGDLHLHSSDDLQPSHDAGANTYLEIAVYAKKKGYEYVGFADHNPKVSLGKREIVTILKKRKSNIDCIFSGTKADYSPYFIGLEADVLPDGSLSVPSESVESLDYLIVAVHSVFNMDSQAMTERVLKALSFPKVKILAHPTGRLLGKREGYELEWERVFACCREKNIAIEINAWPERLDLPDSLARTAQKQGVKLCINTDAHANGQMENMLYGVAVARRGWLEKNDIINTLPYQKFKDWLERR